MVLSQADFLFPVHAVPQAGPLPSAAERLKVTTADGNALHGVYLAPARMGGGEAPLMLGFGGNAWNAQVVATYLHGLFPDAHVVAFHYRGYRPSTGSPSAEALMADAPLVLDEAVARARPSQVILVGFSIGSAVAASLASQRKVDGLILVTPFDSLKAVAQDLYPWLPVGPFFQHEMAAADYLSGNQVPVAILAAERDEIVPAARTEALRQRVPNLAYDVSFKGAGHNDIYWRPDFHAALHDALAAVASK